MIKQVFAAIAAAMVVGGCGEPSDQKLLVAARQHIDKNELEAAAVNLKGALKQNEKSAEARFLMGRLLLKIGAAEQAAVELDKASTFGWPSEEVAPLRARALLLAGKDKELIEQFERLEVSQPRANAEVKTALASAHVRRKDGNRARQLVDEALRIAPDYAPAMLLKAGFQAEAEDFPAALATIDKLTAIDPSISEAWQLRGDIVAHSSGDLAAAEAAFRKAIGANKLALNSYQRIILLQLSQLDVAGARKTVDEMLRAAPNHPLSTYAQAQVALVQKEMPKAKEAIERLLRYAPTNVAVLQLAGAVEYESGRLLQAETHLARAVQLEPKLSVGRRLLAQIYIRTGQHPRAMAVLAPLLEQSNADAQSLALGAESELLQGNVAAAEQLFQRASKLDPKDPKIRTVIALLQLARGQSELALGNLQQIASTDDSDLADMALISAHLRRREFDPALQAIARLEKKPQKAAAAASLRGFVLQQKGDLAGARASLERSLTLDPLYLPAAISLERLDLEAGNPKAAQDRYEAMLKHGERNYAVLISLAQLRERTGAPTEEITSRLSEIAKLNPSEAAARVALLQHLLKHQLNKQALAAAQEADAALPNTPDIVDALGVAQLRMGETQQALSSLNKAATLSPRSPQPHLRLADAYTALNDQRNAAASLRRALEVSPGLAAAQRSLVNLALRAKDMNGALAVAKQAQKQRPQDALGYVLEGDIEVRRKNTTAAAAAYRAALPFDEAGEASAKLHALLLQLGRKAEADQMLAARLKERPNDLAVVMYAGSRAIEDRDYDQAEARYRTALKLDPINALAYNNLAWLLLRAGKPGALEMAEKANSLKADEPAMMDTLAQALAAAKQVPKALELQKKVVAIAPDVYVYRLTLARILVQSGDKAQARQELDRLSRLGDRFAQQPEVAELLKTL